jgi:hypothetical protein
MADSSRRAWRALQLLPPLMLAACGSSAPGEGGGARSPAIDPPYAGYQSAEYATTDHWLCHPDLSAGDDVCRAADLRTLSVAADGTGTAQAFVPAADPRVDCFYVYPTASADVGENSDFLPGPQEIQTTQMQAARYGEVCRVFAPVYRQRTLTVLALNVVAGALLPFEFGSNAGEVAYADVLDAFRAYLSQHNDGRGFILVGHSQGASLLRRLIAEEVEPQPYLAQRLVSAHLLGSAVAVPVGQDVGGSFASTPACRAADQAGCVVSYASYRRGDPDLDDPRFGVTGDPATQALCVNPAALGGGAAALDAHLPLRLPPVFQLLLIPRGSGGPYAERTRNAAVSEPYFAVPGQVSGECVVAGNGASYLEITIAADANDPRADDYPGEFFGGSGWGLHLADVNLAQGHLVRLARRQSEAWLQQSR